MRSGMVLQGDYLDFANEKAKFLTHDYAECSEVHCISTCICQKSAENLSVYLGHKIAHLRNIENAASRGTQCSSRREGNVLNIDVDLWMDMLPGTDRDKGSIIRGSGEIDEVSSEFGWTGEGGTFESEWFWRSLER